MLRVLWFVPPAIALAGQVAGGVAVRGDRTRGSDEQFEALHSGTYDLAVTAMDNVIGWNARPGGGDFRVIAQIETTTPLLLIARPGIASIGDLKGRRVLVDSADNGFVVALLAVMRNAGVGRDDVDLIQAGGVNERKDALVAGDGDVTLLGPPFDAQALQQGMARLGSVNESYPQFPGQGVVARTSRLGEIGGEVRQWLQTLETGRRLALSESAKAIAAIESAGIAASAALAMVKGAPKTLAPDRTGVALLIEHRRLLGLPGGQATYDNLVDTRWLQDLGEPQS